MIADVVNGYLTFHQKEKILSCSLSINISFTSLPNKILGSWTSQRNEISLYLGKINNLILELTYIT